MNLIEIHPLEYLLREYLEGASVDFASPPNGGGDGYYWMPSFHPVIPMDTSESAPMFNLGGTRLLAWRRLSLEERGLEVGLLVSLVERYGCAVTNSRPLWTDYLGFGSRSAGRKRYYANNRNSP